MTGKGKIIGLVGIWVIAAGLWRFNPLGEVWSDIFAGVIVGILGFSLSPSIARYRWLTGLAGVWLIAAAFIPALNSGTPIEVHNLIVGLLVMILGFTQPATFRREDRTRDRAA